MSQSTPEPHPEEHPPPGQPQQGFPQQPPTGASQGQAQQPPQGYPQQPPQGGQALPPVAPSEERTWSIVAHAGGILVGFLAPLIVWLSYKDRSARLDDQGKEALNFQLTILIAYVVGWILTMIVIGGLIVFAAWVCTIIFGILGAMAASRDEWYRYPFKIRFIK
ncbi:DUF4870 domain-containing protein [Isoptericola sp. 178]|uniref:DUF4870 domain-containing protein n=1 Tax=Isoptericola sp. 178 TaxID=3064651 RepID=UPI0027139740|nr:DUF4870 domain-containing protein [Isoptericola sp. 178]MDO8145354.1 DUF4870 domain-containing protein [Isoptericola sp. 178]